MTDMITEYAERTNVARYGESFIVNGISVISGRCAGNNEGNNEWLCAMELLNPICIKSKNLECV